MTYQDRVTLFKGRILELKRLLDTNSRNWPLGKVRLTEGLLKLNIEIYRSLTKN